MFNKLFEAKSKQSANNHNNDATAQWIELKELTKQTAITALPFDVLFIIFDHVKAGNLKTYKAALPLVNKNWHRMMRLKNEALQKRPLYQSIELLLSRYLAETESKQTIRDLLPYRKQEREKLITRLLHTINVDLANGDIIPLLFQLNVIFNNSAPAGLKEVINKVIGKIFNSLNMDEMQKYIKDYIEKSHHNGAYPGNGSQLSFVEQLLHHLYKADKATTEHKMFVTDCFLVGFEQGNYNPHDSRLSRLGESICELVAANKDNPETLGKLHTQLNRFNRCIPYIPPAVSVI